MKIDKQLKRQHVNSLNQWLVIISFSVFVPIFFILFKPFGMVQSEDDSIHIILIGNGFITFLALVFNVFLITKMFKSFFDESNWTFFKQLVWMLWNILSVSSANLIYIQFLSGSFSMSLDQFLWFLGVSFAIALIPISILSLINHNKNLKQHLKDAMIMNQKIENNEEQPMRKSQVLQLFSENQKLELETAAKDLIYISSNGNYVNIYHLVEDKLHLTTIRSTIKSMEEQMLDSAKIRRLHRAYLVNTQHIIHIKGNSQAYKLKLNYIDALIPVSRSYIKSLKETI